MQGKFFCLNLDYDWQNHWAAARLLEKKLRQRVADCQLAASEKVEDATARIVHKLFGFADVNETSRHNVGARNDSARNAIHRHDHN